MHTLSLSLVALTAYLLVHAAEFWLGFLNQTHMKKHGTKVPPGFEGHVDEEVLKKTISYTAERNRLGVIESAFSSLVLIAFIYAGVLDWYNNRINALGLPFVLQGVVFFLLLSFVNTLLSIPFSLYSTFKIEDKYGFNTMNIRLWLTDLVKSLLISWVLMTVVLSASFWLMQLSPDRWWLFVWGLFFVFSIFMMYVSPYVIEPLFNKFTPLEGHELEDRLRTVMEKAGITVSRVFTMDASKRSGHTNAYFTGIGRVKRIVLFDTLLKKMDADEIVAVLAHEAGHWKKKHVLRMIAVFEALALVGAWAVSRLLQTDLLSRAFGIQSPTVFSDLLLIGFLFGIVSFPATPLFSAFSRRHEREADSFASEISGRPDSLASSLIKLSKDNLSNLFPHPLYAWFYYSHPPVVERVRALKETGRNHA
ncbi:MAG: M48 family metallopeptidase [Thermodesulfovibrionales bacterium]